MTAARQASRNRPVPVNRFRMTQLRALMGSHALKVVMVLDYLTVDLTQTIEPLHLITPELSDTFVPFLLHSPWYGDLERGTQEYRTTPCVTPGHERCA
jgi:hypothetical protein